MIMGSGIRYFGPLGRRLGYVELYVLLHRSYYKVISLF